jgi:2-alkyl-3-oxoalkanoate reductase
MRVFVAGATGVLGRQVVRELLDRGHAVTGLARRPENERLLRALGAAPAAGDLFDAGSLARAAAGTEVVMHLATATPSGPRQRLRDWKLNDRIRTEGTAALLEASRRVGARCYIQQSTALVHGSAGDAWVDENSPRVPHRVFDSAVAMEGLVCHAGREHGLATVILRGGMLYHRDASSTRQMLAGIRSGSLPVVGMGDSFRSLVHVADMARACVIAAETRPAGEAFLVVDDEPVRVRDLFTHLARLSGGPKPRYLLPIAARLLMGALAVDLAMVSLRCRNAKIKRHLGWAPEFPSYREGFAAMGDVGASVHARPSR